MQRQMARLSSDVPTPTTSPLTARPVVRWLLRPTCLNVIILVISFAVLYKVSHHVIRLLTQPTGDEPWYMMQAYTLIHFHSFDLAPAVHNPTIYSSFLPGGLADTHTRDYIGNGERVLWLLPGYAIAIAPFYAVGGRALVVAFQALVTALTSMLVFDEARRLFGSLVLAVFTWLVFLGALPVLLYAGQIFPSALAMCATFLGFVLVSRWLPDARGGRLMSVSSAIGCLAFALPWLHFRYAPLAVLLLACAVAALWPRLRLPSHSTTDRQAWLAVSTIAGFTLIGFGLIVVYSHHFFGTLLPQNGVAPDFAHPNPTNALKLFRDMFFDGESGLIPWVPIDLLALPGLVLLLRRFPREGRYVTAFLAVQLGAFLTATVQPLVYQGYSLPARFTVECSPFFALCVGAVLSGPRVREVLDAAVQRATQVLPGLLYFVRPASSHAPRLDPSRRLARYAGISAVSLLAVALLAASCWFSFVAQKDPNALYPSAPPATIRLQHEYPTLLPHQWFDLFPPRAVQTS